MFTLRYLSVCSGIESASVAWQPLGWEAVAFSEIEAFPCALLKQHYPSVPNWGDMTEFKDWPDADIDLLVGGTPCQSFSVAGLRKGLDDPRGSLMLVYLAIARRYRPRWVVWENVPGVLSSDDGRAFGTLLGGLAVLGYGFAYRVLDAQYFGLAQRRKRVFVVGHLGDWRRAAAVLFERESLSGHPAPRREAREGTPVGALGGTSPGGGWRVGADEAAAGQLVPHAYGGNNTSGEIDVATAVRAKGGTGHGDFESETFIAHALRADGFDASEDGTGRGTPLVPIAFDTTQITHPENRSNPQPGGPSPSLAKGAHPPAIAFQESQSGARLGDTHPTLDSHNGSRRHHGVVAFDARQSDVIEYGGMSGPIDTDGHTVSVRQSMRVRRLTPMECERLQGFPDGYTAIRHRGKPAADGPRYKALGNAKAVPVVRWIGRRIQMVEEL